MDEVCFKSKLIRLLLRQEFWFILLVTFQFSPVIKLLLF